MLGSLITNHMATLYELQTIYSYQDAIVLYDILLTNNANELRAIRYFNKKGK